MPALAPALDNLTLSITQEILVRASIEKAFASLLEQLGPANQGINDAPMPMTLEAHPGGRWFRDLGGDNGHFWGVVQAIKRPTLLEITGPLFMSAPVVSNLQYRLNEVPDGTLITLNHSAFGLVPENYREGMAHGWARIFERVRKQVEGK
jgi:Activator of Hsp90 ATPase homolog 1-like protein